MARVDPQQTPAFSQAGANSLRALCLPPFPPTPLKPLASLRGNTAIPQLPTDQNTGQSPQHTPHFGEPKQAPPLNQHCSTKLGVL